MQSDCKSKCMRRYRQVHVHLSLYQAYTIQFEVCNKLEMWANAQRDGRPAQHRWAGRPLFNAAKFG